MHNRILEGEGERGNESISLLKIKFSMEKL